MEVEVAVAVGVGLLVGSGVLAMGGNTLPGGGSETFQVRDAVVIWWIEFDVAVMQTLASTTSVTPVNTAPGAMPSTWPLMVSVPLVVAVAAR